MIQVDRNDLKRRAPAPPLGLATARLRDWARSFLGCDRIRHYVPSPTGPRTDSRQSNGWRRCRRQENVLALDPHRKGPPRKSF